MLARWVVAVWLAWLGTLGLASALNALGVGNPNPILPVGLSVLMLAAGLGLAIAATFRLVRGPRRDRALAWLLAGTAPFWFLAGHVLTAMRPAFDRHAAPGWATRVFTPLARPLVDLGSRRSHPARTPGRRVTRIAPTAEDARAEVAAMDRHVEAVLARLGRAATWPIAWYRGPLFGLQSCSIDDLAIGSPVGLYQTEADGLNFLDRHEVAHSVLTGFCTPRSDPPRLLMEGWAQANQGTPAAALADVAWDDRENGRSLPLRRLVDPDWYWYSGPAAYNQGAPLVDHLLRTYGPERFLKLYTTCRQETFESDLRDVLGVGLDELDAAYWSDVERVVRTGPPARRWLKGLKLGEGVDPAAWDAFLADYFDAAARLVAPYDHVRMTTTFRIERGGGDPHEYEEHLSLLRSGRFARVRQRLDGYEKAILANPRRSLRAGRELRPEAGPWRITEDARDDPSEAHRRAMEAVASASSNHFMATHGGAALLEYPRNLERDGLSTDYDVVELDAATRDGRRLVTLRLRTSPEVEGRGRRDVTFVLDADDLFVARSVRFDASPEGFDSEARLAYDHPDGRPVLRSAASTVPAASLTIRLDVEECRFGPIPESEFAPEAFLADLGPGVPPRPPAVEPPAARLLGWSRLAFVAGGASLAGGACLALGGRLRDRRRRRAG